MKKVLHLVLSLNVGGLEQFVLNLSRAQLKYVKPSIYCLDSLGDLGFRENELSIHYPPSPHSSILQKSFALIQYISNNHFDILHSHNFGPHIHGAIASTLTGIPLIHTKHGNLYPTRFMHILLEKFSYRRTNTIVTVSKEARDSYLQATMCDHNNVITILNGIDVDGFKSNGNTKTGQMTITIGIVARLAPEKDHMTLINAFKIASNIIPSLRLIIVGDGPLKQNLVNFVHDSGLSDKATFFGTCFDIPNILLTFDIFVLSSTTEGISISLLEAMASSLPCIATDAGGNKEVVIDGETGYIVPPSNPKLMADRIVTLAKNASLRIKLGSSGKERVSNYFSIDSTAHNYKILYDSLTSKS